MRRRYPESGGARLKHLTSVFWRGKSNLSGLNRSLGGGDPSVKSSRFNLSAPLVPVFMAAIGLQVFFTKKIAWWIDLPLELVYEDLLGTPFVFRSGYVKASFFIFRKMLR